MLVKKLASFGILLSSLLAQNSFAEIQLSFSILKRANDAVLEPQRWDCGPRAVHMVLAMLDAKLPNGNAFVESCPKSFGNPQCSETQLAQGFVMSKNPILGFALSMVGKVGPYAKCLAQYTNKAQDQYIASAHQLSHVDEVISVLRKEISAQRPVILKISNGLLLHYPIAVALDEEAKTVTLLEPSNLMMETVSFDELSESMDLANYREKLLDKLDEVPLNVEVVKSTISSGAMKDILSHHNIISFEKREDIGLAMEF